MTARRMLLDLVELVLAIAIIIALCSVATPAASAASWPSQGAAHSGRCRGELQPRMLGIFGPGWVCTRDGWRLIVGPSWR